MLIIYNGNITEQLVTVEWKAINFKSYSFFFKLGEFIEAEGFKETAQLPK